jgi:hypothetical protein
VLLQFVVRLRQQFGDGVGGEELGAHALAGGFGRHRLDAVLAEFGGGMLAVGPGAAGAVEAVRLVLLEQRLVIAAGDRSRTRLMATCSTPQPAAGWVYGAMWPSGFLFMCGR